MGDHRIVIINVGANMSHGALRSPLFEDQTFEFVPISDGYVDGLPRYSSFVSQCGRPAEDFVPTEYLNQAMHDDPEFKTFTYGDSPENNSRAANLKKLKGGDSLLFLARLVEWSEKKGWGQGGFYLVGELVLDRVVKKSDFSSNPGLVRSVENNAHVKRWLLNPYLEPHNSWIFVGSNHSVRYHHAVPFDGELMVQVLRKADGSPIVKKDSMSDLSFVGCNTRACRIIDAPSRMKLLREHIVKFR